MKKIHVPIGVSLVGLMIAVILGETILVAVLWLAWKLGNVPESYAQKL